MYKPLITALALPPVPWMLLILMGGVAVLRGRRGLGIGVIVAAVVALWVCACQGTATWIQDEVLRPGPSWVERSHEPVISGEVAIVVLGAGRDAMAREYGTADLGASSAERLRYGIWLSRKTGFALGFSGGVGWQQQGVYAGAPEAEVAQRVAHEQYGQPIRWVESRSADTRQNAANTVAMMAGHVKTIVLVTHAFHMQRAERAFVEAARGQPNAFIRIERAPMGYWGEGDRQMLDWLPSSEGMKNVYTALRECIGLLAGA
ncbi:MAG: YdcF family protein [Aquabacterium sp.]